MGKRVRLSQCMIVKNEEKNIEKALSWGKEVVCEQIVVDTGSTDRTVEIAEQMGAKVFHYKWHNDFAAAKNYAIEQAAGNWIAFLDADEYFTQKDAKQLKIFLRDISASFPVPDMVTCPWMQLNDEGQIFAVSVQQRIFRNIPQIRYENRIHEALSRTDKRHMTQIRTEDKFPIYHTGYTKEAYEETRKTTRNKEILISILKENPEDYINLGYLGDSYFAEGNVEKAEETFREAVAHHSQVPSAARNNTSFSSLMRIIYQKNESDAEKEMRMIYDQFAETGENCPDMEYWMGLGMMQKRKLKDGIYWLETALKKLEQYQGDESLFIMANQSETYRVLAYANKELGALSQSVRYCTIALRADKKKAMPLALLLQLFAEDQGTTAAAALEFLSKIYDFSDVLDRVFVLEVAKKASYPGLEKELSCIMTEEDWKVLEEMQGETQGA
ncbi:glycosyltransferase family 2 protein [Muricomes intestini]|uniref:Glycosyl transferase family 2 n=3 Tax=Muricomes intestini TaxID=1796634 RepID=A0A4R3K1M0_9FIRM|nr:glycosyltransferase family 2 protein [Muricomes intestini]TCS75609.1 glycosyl transferase family 2 [Muricomes intestini]